ncbi:hypothetical protein N0B31_08515 [Salinirubellus salinus]|uniref:Uncharacterized protein n=1 Tax=Salinirubellus salinus TaxID=1364945 RepID=A0A9E7U9U8_9EURY|nr:hypothetical protein [Salinirubellus salinus]UWM56326.1 hypothetical protein N0B31_08515 [Salinirubellus salinus]
MSPAATRFQLCGIALILFAGLRDLQVAVYGYGDPGEVGVYIATTGALMPVSGLVFPVLTGTSADD